MRGLWKAVLGVLVVTFGVYIGNILYVRFVINQAEKAMNSVAQIARDQAEKARMQQIQLEQERTRQKQMELDFKREQLAEQAAQLEAARLKEEAWDRFYKKPAKCNDISKQEVMIECGNFYIKEKKRFEAIWASKSGATQFSPQPGLSSQND